MRNVLQGQNIADALIITPVNMALICTLSADEKTGPESLQRLRVCCRAKN